MGVMRPVREYAAASGKVPEALLSCKEQKPILSGWLGELIADLGAWAILGRYRDETEGAIDSIKRSNGDRWFRRQWYQAARSNRAGRGPATRSSTAEHRGVLSGARTSIWR